MNTISVPLPVRRPSARAPKRIPAPFLHFVSRSSHFHPPLSAFPARTDKSATGPPNPALHRIGTTKPEFAKPSIGRDALPRVQGAGDPLLHAEKQEFGKEIVKKRQGFPWGRGSKINFWYLLVPFGTLWYPGVTSDPLRPWASPWAHGLFVDPLDRRNNGSFRSRNGPVFRAQPSDMQITRSLAPGLQCRSLLSADPVPFPVIDPQVIPCPRLGSGLPSGVRWKTAQFLHHFCTKNSVFCQTSVGLQPLAEEPLQDGAILVSSASLTMKKPKPLKKR